MTINKEFIEQFVNVTQKAALSSYYFIGKKNKIAADKAAVDSMRAELNQINMNGKIVIGEGELDKAPMLYIGEKLGSGKGLSLDIAVDPVEGTNFVAKNLPGGLSVLALSEKGNLFNAPETYMNKIAVGKNIDKDAIDIDYDLKKKNWFNIGGNAKIFYKAQNLKELIKFLKLIENFHHFETIFFNVYGQINNF